MEKQGVTGPSPHFMLGNLPERARMREQEMQQDMHAVTHDIVGRLMPDYVQWSKTYGKQFMFWWGVEPRLTVSEPEFIRDVLSSKHVLSFGRSNLQRKGVNNFIGNGLLMANGEAWAHQRRVIAPAFHLDKLKEQVGHMVESTFQMLERWAHELITKDGMGWAEIEVGEHMNQLAGDVIARTEFGSSYEEGKIIFAKLNEMQKLSSTQFGIQRRLRGLYRIRKLKKDVEKCLRLIIQARRRTIITTKSPTSSLYGHDLLGLILSEIEAAHKDHIGASFPYTSQQLIIDECKTFFFTGQDTVSMLLTWTIMLLASNPIWQQRVREEVINACQGRPPDADALGKLKLLNMVLLESLRLYTPATLLSRQAFSDMKVGDLFIPKGLSLWIPVLAIHHDKSMWGEDANEFNPERFAGGAAEACKHPMGYLPFSMGPRSCVGQNFAMMEAKVVLAMILSRYGFQLSANYRHAPVFVLTLKPKHGVPIIIHSLKN